MVGPTCRESESARIVNIDSGVGALREEAKIENRLAEVLQALTPKTPSQDQPNSQEQPQPEEAPANNP